MERANHNASSDLHARRDGEPLGALREADLIRRPGCDPVLRALALDRVTLQMRAHIAGCPSCRKAAEALRENTPRATRRRWLLVVALVAVVAVIATPFLVSRLSDDPSLLPSHATRGGVALPAGEAA